jgi:hypothetical protein
MYTRGGQTMDIKELTEGVLLDAGRRGLFTYPDIKERIENVLLEFMDNTYDGFESGYFTQADPKEVRDRLIEALEKVDK